MQPEHVSLWLRPDTASKGNSQTRAILFWLKLIEGAVLEGQLRADERRVVEVSSYLAGWSVEGRDLPTPECGHLLREQGVLDTSSDL